MVILEFRLVGKRRQYAALDEAIRTTQFIRNKCVRYWQDTRDVTPYDLNTYCAVLACAYDFVRKLNSMAARRRSVPVPPSHASTRTVVRRNRARRATRVPRRTAAPWSTRQRVGNSMKGAVHGPGLR
jgi:hypothetical protein